MPEPQPMSRPPPREETSFDIVERLSEPIGVLRAVRDEGGRLVDFLIEYANPAATLVGGVPREQQMGRTLLEVFPAHEQLGLLEAYRRVVETGQPFATEGLVYEDVIDGKRQEFGAFDVYAVKLGDGLLTSWHDCSERAAAEARLRTSEERLRLLVESIRDFAIFMLDPQGRVLTWSAGAQLLQGYTAEEVIGLPDAIFLPPEDEDTWTRKALSRAQREGRYETEAWRVKKDGTRFWAQVLITPVFDEHGALRGFTKMIRDLSEQRRAREQEAEARRLRALQRLTERLMSTVTVEETARVVAEHGAEAQAGVSGCVVGIRVEGAEELYLVTSRGECGGRTWAGVRVPLTQALPVAEACRDGTPLWLETEEEIRQHYPDTHGDFAQGSRALAALPLLTEVGSVGAIAFGFEGAQRFDEEQRSFLLTLSRLCAQAMERTRLAEQSRRRAEHLALLAETSRHFQEAGPDLPSVLQAISERIGRGMRGSCIVRLLSEDDARIRTVAVYHPDARALATLRARRQWEPAHAGLTGRVVVTQQPLYAPVVDVGWSAENTDASSGSDLDELSIQSLIIAPLLVRGRAIGCLLVARDEPELPLDREDVGLVEELADRAALAIDNARLLEAEQRAREDAHRHAERLRLLADASQLFAESSLDVPSVLDAVVGAVGHYLGDGCAVHLLAADGRHLELASMFQPGLARRLSAAELREADRVLLGEGLHGRVAESGQPVFLPVVDEERLKAQLPPAHRAYVERHGLVSAAVVPLRASGRVIGTLGVARFRGSAHLTEEDAALIQELADRAALALENAQLYDDIRASVRVRDDFLSIAGHELRTPLAALQLYLHSLLRALERSEPTATRDKLERMQKNADRLGRLISELLDVSRVVGGRLSLELDDVDLGRIARDVADLYESDLERTGCSLSLSLPEHPVVGRWDRGRLEQVVLNLLVNAGKYGRGQPIDIGVRAQEGRGILTVRDRGIGIAAEDQARIFERFERAVSSTNFGGLGLGLWISRQIVEAHGGRIRVESRPGEGALFTVELPLASRGGSA